MKVRELIEKLQKFDGEDEVLLQVLFGIYTRVATYDNTLAQVRIVNDCDTDGDGCLLEGKRKARSLEGVELTVEDREYL